MNKKWELPAVSGNEKIPEIIPAKDGKYYPNLHFQTVYFQRWNDWTYQLQFGENTSSHRFNKPQMIAAYQDISKTLTVIQEKCINDLRILSAECKIQQDGTDIEVTDGKLWSLDRSIPAQSLVRVLNPNDSTPYNIRDILPTVASLNWVLWAERSNWNNLAVKFWKQWLNIAWNSHD
jgi:hypothetical protein